MNEPLASGIEYADSRVWTSELDAELAHTLAWPQKMVEHLEDVLYLYNEADSTLDWACTQSSLGLVLETLGQQTADDVVLNRACECFAAAARGFGKAGLTDEARDAISEMRAIEEEISAK